MSALPSHLPGSQQANRIPHSRGHRNTSGAPAESVLQPSPFSSWTSAQTVPRQHVFCYTWHHVFLFSLSVRHASSWITHLALQLEKFYTFCQAAFKGSSPSCGSEKGYSTPGQNTVVSDRNLLFITCLTAKRTQIKTKNCLRIYPTMNRPSDAFCSVIPQTSFCSLSQDTNFEKLTTQGDPRLHTVVFSQVLRIAPFASIFLAPNKNVVLEVLQHQMLQTGS